MLNKLWQLCANLTISLINHSLCCNCKLIRCVVLVLVENSTMNSQIKKGQIQVSKITNILGYVSFIIRLYLVKLDQLIYYCDTCVIKISFNTKAF